MLKDTRRVYATLYATVGGRIWMPAVNCTKEIKVDLNQESARYSDGWVGTFRHLMVGIACDGDFQTLAKFSPHSFIKFETISVRGRKEHHTVSYRPLTDFPSIADLIHSEDEWYDNFDLALDESE